MSKTTLSYFLEQAVNNRLSFGTLLTLLNIASKRDCHSVRYLQPPPQEFGVFVAPPDNFKRFDYREMVFREPEELTLHQLCEASFVVVKKISEYHNRAEEAEERATKAEHRAMLEEKEKERVTDLLRKYAPHLFTYALDDEPLP